MVIWTTTPWTLPANLGHRRGAAAGACGEATLGRDGWAEDFFVARPLLEAFVRETELQIYGELASQGEQLAGLEAQHPFLDRKSRVIAADFVTSGHRQRHTHVAPGHGADDYKAGRYTLRFCHPSMTTGN